MLLPKLREICDKNNVTILFTHHLNKQGKVLGSTAFDAVVDGKLTKRNGFGLTEFAVRYYGIKINSIIGKTIDIDVIYHKAGDTFINLWGNKDKFKKDCIEVKINKVIK